jgi:uncharacterized protein (TIGR03437 family)
MRRLILSGVGALICLAVPLTTFAQRIITTVAGSDWAPRADGRPALEAPLGFIWGVAVDSAGNVYAADTGNHQVVKASRTGILTVAAGNGIDTFSGDGGSAISASLNVPTSVAVDRAGNIYIADWHNHRVRKVTPDGVIMTLAGNGSATFSGDGGPATRASLNDPRGVAVDGGNNVYIADAANQRIRMVNSSGVITTVAGNGVYGFAGDGGPATRASLAYPLGVAVGPSGELYIADSGNHRVRAIDATGGISTLAGNGTQGFSGDGGPAPNAALNQPNGVAVDAVGAVYIADSFNHRLRKVTGDKTIVTVAGNGIGGFAGDNGPAVSAALNRPFGVAVDASGRLYIADELNQRIRSVSAAGVISTIAGNGLFKYAGDGGPAGAASLNSPYTVARDTWGSFYIADTFNHRIRKIRLDGSIITIAGNGTRGFSGDGGPATNAALIEPYGVTADSAGNVYFADQGNHRVRKINAQGLISTVAGNGVGAASGDGGAATSASLNFPSGVAVDASNNLYIADSLNERIRKVVTDGTITTIAGNGVRGSSGDGGPATGASLNFPSGVAVDANGNVYIADSGNHRIRKVGTNRTITTVAGTGAPGFGGDGGAATGALLNLPVAVAVDGAGNLYTADRDNHRVRTVNLGGVISTLAGNGVQEFDGDGGPATRACLSYPSGLALDAAGNVYVADSANDRIREVLALPPSFSVSPGTLDFSAVAGSTAFAGQQITLNSAVGGLVWQGTARVQGGGHWLALSPSSGQIPATASVFIDATDLVPGTYQGFIDISVPLATSALQTVAVTVSVLAPPPPALSVRPLALIFQGSTGGTASAQPLHIENGGGGKLTWTAEPSTDGGAWLSVSPRSGMLTAGTPADVQINVNLVGLTVGSYSGTITVQSTTANEIEMIPVRLIVSEPSGVLVISQTSMLFRTVQDGGASSPQTFGVLNDGIRPLDWKAETTVGWMRLSSPGRRTPADPLQCPSSADRYTTASGTSTKGAEAPFACVYADPAGLAPGYYAGTIRVTANGANNSPQVVQVGLSVSPGNTKLGAIVRPTSLIFVAVAGTSSPGSKEVTISTTETTAVEFQASASDAPWVTRLPDRGTATGSGPGRIVVQPQLGNLAPGVYSGTLVVQTPGDGGVYPVRLLLQVLPSANAVATTHDGSRLAFDNGSTCVSDKLLLQFASLFTSFSATVGWPTTVLISARDNCGSPAVGGQVWVTFSNGDPPLTLKDLNNGQYVGNWQPNRGSSTVVYIRAQGLWRGLREEIRATASVGPNSNPKGLLNQGGVLLAAGFRPGPVAPGSVISLFGRNLAGREYAASELPLPSRLGEVRVLIGDQAAPLFYAGREQINAQVPFELPADRQLQVYVETDGVPSAPEPLVTVSNQPGIFTLPPEFGKQQGAILIANTDRLAMRAMPGVPSQPVTVGTVVSIFCTGLGATEPAAASGQPGPGAEPLARVKTQVGVAIGGQPANVSYAGMAPGLVGVYQVNAEVPPGVSPGDQVPVVITQAGARSNTATIAVR